MKLADATLVPCRPGSDVTFLAVTQDVDVTDSVTTFLGVFDADSEDTSPATPLTTAALSRDACIKLAGALLARAFVDRAATVQDVIDYPSNS